MIEALIAAGIINGGLIAMVMLYRGVIGRNGAAVLIGLALAMAVGVVLLIQTGAPLRSVEVILTVLAGVLIVTVTGRLLGRGPRPAVLIAAISGGCLAIGGADRLLGGDPVRPAVLIQMAFTVWAWTLYVRAPRRAQGDKRSSAHRRITLTLAILSGVTILHAAQLLRLALPDNPLFRSVVPLTLGVIFIAASAAIAFRLISVRDLAPLNAFRAVSGGADDGLLVRLRAYLDDAGRYARADTDLASASVALGVEPSRIAERLQMNGYAGWADYLRWLRIDHARRQLADPAEARTSIDAIGLGCGFRARSAFYEAFEREVGLTPGAYRRQQLSRNVSG